ncbi:MAG: hypothetical protein L0K34_02740 [Ancrocorticia sp.]|nr:hypothetical protein [Ancrocorticia sp.]
MIVWAGSQEDLGYRLLAAGTTEHVIAKSGDLGEVLSLREPAWSGVAVPPGTGALRLAENSDGLAKAVGFADTLAFAGGLPGAFGFLSRVAGMVEAVRQASGQEYLAGYARVNATGPEAWAALAALTQLRVERIESTPDALVGAVAHRLWITVTPPQHEPTIEFDPTGFRWDGARASNERVELYTAGAQIRLLTSREPDIEAMMAACG